MKKAIASARHLLVLGQYINDPDEFHLSETRKRTLTGKVLDDLADLNLDGLDVFLIAAVFQYSFEGGKMLGAMDVLRKILPDQIERLQYLDRISNLIVLQVLEPCQKQYHRRDRDGHRLELALDRINLLDMDIRLHPQFLARLLGEIHEDPETIDSPYQDNREFIKDWFSCVEAQRNYANVRQFDEEVVNHALEDLNKWEKRLEKRMNSTSEIFPFCDLTVEYNLDRKEQIILMYMLKEELDGMGCARDELLDLISEDKFDKYGNARYFDGESTLLRHGLIEAPENMFFSSSGLDVRLAPDLASRILRTTPRTDSERITEIIRSSDVLKLTTPALGLEKVILPSDTKNLLETAVRQCRENVGSTLHHWGLDQGVFQREPAADQAYKPAMLLMFYGLPGTGKTLAAGALAHALGKEVLVTDISRVLSKWVGESESNVRRIFAQYEQIVRRTDNPPVLLLNECDQFLTARGAAEHAADRMYNQMQNLFLEAFERLQGLLIATTNLRDNLDPAFSRRFHLKIEFPIPDTLARQKLWQIHLPDSIPRAADLDLATLAQDYTLTGGQIAVVVKNAAVEAAQLAPKHRRLSRELLAKYARLEADSAFGITSGQRIGF
ncbi:MAG: ATP-binding protein [bacterium]|nr:ATP-binding protein [bacterium]